MLLSPNVLSAPPDVLIPVCATLTVTLQVALLPPAFAVIVAVPPPTAVILPPLVTVATFELDEEYVTVLFVASEGVTVADNCAVPPFLRLTLVVLREMPVTGFVTVTLPPVAEQE